MLDSTNLYSFMPPTINQSQRDYSVRHGVCTYAVLTNQSAAIAYVTGHTYAVLTNQSAAMAYVTEDTYAVLTNQSTAIVNVTVCTSRGVRTLFDQSARDILAY